MEAAITRYDVYALGALALFSIGLHGLIVCRHLVRKVIAINFAGSGVFLLLVAFSHRTPGTIDPVPQAMVLTGIVVAFAATGFALGLVLRIFRESGRAVLDRGDPLRRP
jgi:multicomponent Na+:H+ antiporter subunit C